MATSTEIREEGLVFLLDEQLQITLKARAAATAWVNTFLASSDDEYRQILYRTLSLELFEHGVQLVATNGIALFRTWVPAIGVAGKRAAWPEADEAPEKSIIVMDPDGFGLAFMKALLRVTNDEAHALEELTITTARADDEGNLLLSSEFMTERVILRACGQRIDLRLFDSTYPRWRELQLGVDELERVEGMTIARKLFALVGKIKGVTAVDLDFHGETRHIAFEARGEERVRGIMMPMRRIEPARESED